MKVAPIDVHLVELGVCDPELVGVGPLVEPSVDLKSGGGRGAGDEVDDRLQRDERLAAPVDRDEGEEAVLDLG
jgi:hypothetical protein